MSEITFQDLGLSEVTLTALAAKGFVHPTPIQAQSIPILLEGKYDVIGQAQTGTGKTAAFGLPIVELVKPDRKLKALVLAPTRELAMQVSEEIQSFSPKLRVLTVYGGASMMQQLKELKRGVEVVVGTPGRVMDHMRRGSLRPNELEFFVLDEADEMLNMGFVDDIETILKETNPDKKMLFFSATMPQKIKNLASTFMREIKTVSIERKTLTSDTVTQYYHLVKPSQKSSLLTYILEAEDDFYGLIFTNTKMDADRLGASLVELGHTAEVLHGDVSQAQREKILAKFKRKVVKVLIATDVAARGIDVNDLTHVVNFSLPQDPEAYVHRIGRTGRAGKTGIAVSLVNPGDAYKLRTIERLSKIKLEKRDIPDPQAIIESKKQNLLKQLAKSIEESSNQDYLEMAQELTQEYDPAEVVSYLLKQSYGERFLKSSYGKIEEVKGRRERPDSRYGDREGGRGDRDRDRGRGRDRDRGHDRDRGQSRERDFSNPRSGSLDRVSNNSSRLFVAMGTQG